MRFNQQAYQCAYTEIQLIHLESTYKAFREPSSHSFNGSIQCSPEFCEDFSGVALWRCYKLVQVFGF